jgi:ADP-ribose pyrophosphatase YjhB (NUDIX family)
MPNGLEYGIRKAGERNKLPRVTIIGAAGVPSGGSMAQIRQGERIGREGKLAVGCSAAIFDPTHTAILVTQRADNQQWCVPGGYMEPGESLTEACQREVYEETGLHVTVERLINVYTHPHQLIVYPDGNQWQLVVLHFAARVQHGTLTSTPETLAARYVTQAESMQLRMRDFDRLRIADAFVGSTVTLIRDHF